jgi:murein DD-endopeptidase MepM/ murein hydrolase activator NlpD
MSKARPIAIVAALLLAGSAATGSYTVAWGDTLSSIARRLGVSVGDLAAANGIADPNVIRAGRRLQLPGAPAEPAVQLAASVGPAGGASHTVAPGENLATIARRHGTTVAELVRLNNIADANYVRAGQTIVVSPAAAWGCPVQGADRWSFVDSFGAPRAGGRVHQGIDVFAARGTPVVANAAGHLTHVQGANAGLAYYLQAIDGLTYYGAHLDTYARGEGPVAAGEVIGSVGNTGNAATTPPHLHFSMERPDGTILNPYTALAGAC